MKKLLLLLNLMIGLLASAQINFPDAQFKAFLVGANASNARAFNASNQAIAIDTDLNGEIDLTEAAAVFRLRLESTIVSDITGIQQFSGLNKLELYYNAITAIDVSGMATLTNLEIVENPVTALNVSGCTSLQALICTYTPLTSIDISGLTALTSVELNDNSSLADFTAVGCTSFASFGPNGLLNTENLVNVNISGCTQFTNLSFSASNSVNVSNCTGLLSLSLFSPTLSSLNVTGCSALQNLYANNNSLTTLDLSGCTSLQLLEAHDNSQLSTINLADCVNIKDLWISDNAISNFSWPGFEHLEWIDLTNNDLVTLDVSDCPALELLQMYGNLTVTSVNLAGCSALENIYFNSTELQTLNTTGCDAVQNIEINALGNNPAPIPTLDFSDLANLSTVTLRYFDTTELLLQGSENLTSITLTDVNIENLDISGQPTEFVNITTCMMLKNIFAKNGVDETFNFSYLSAAPIAFICQDEPFIAATLAFVQSEGMQNTVVNSYCSIYPGGDYNTVTGTIRFDLDSDGCDAQDEVQPAIRIDMTSGSGNASTFSDASGHYRFFLGTGNHNLALNIENPGIFSITPSPANVSFANLDNNQATQDFCISSVGNQNDAEIVIAPIITARPGFAATYLITIRNKGNQALSGTFNFTYPEATMDFVSSELIANVQAAGFLQWNYTDLLPFEHRSFRLVFNVNSPTQTPAVNNGDILHFTATINPISGDINPQDNQFNFDQTVVGSYDPNDITCIEGDVVSPSEIGNYLHYVVNFENTGTAAAENVVIKVEVDQNQYDISSLQLLDTSHDSYTRIRGNIVEFIFEGIELESPQGDPPTGGHGNVLFKIKSKASLIEGDEVTKKANIFFDYNFPIETNLAETVFQSLKTPGFEIDASVSVYPNPSSGIANVNTTSQVKSIEVFDVQGRLLQTALSSKTIDISNQPAGLYFVRIKTENGIAVEKLSKR